MSNFTPLDEQYPNENLGLRAFTDANVGSGNVASAPLKLNTAGNTTGAVLNSGSGSPGLTGATARIGGNTGDVYLRTDGTTAIYRCSSSGPATSAGGTTGAVWVEVA